MRHKFLQTKRCGTKTTQVFQIKRCGTKELRPQTLTSSSRLSNSKIYINSTEFYFGKETACLTACTSTFNLIHLRWLSSLQEIGGFYVLEFIP